MTTLAASNLFIDTLKIFNLLTNAGFTKSQAEAISSVASEARADLAPYAAKTEVARLEDKIVDRLGRIDQHFDKIDQRFDRLEERINNTIYWFTAALFAQGAFIVGLLQLLK